MDYVNLFLSIKSASCTWDKLHLVIIYKLNFSPKFTSFLDTKEKLEMIMKVHVLKDHVNGCCELNCSGNTGPDSLCVFMWVYIQYLGPVFSPAEKQLLVKKEKGRWAINKIVVIFALLGNTRYKTIHLQTFFQFLFYVDFCLWHLCLYVIFLSIILERDAGFLKYKICCQEQMT